MPTLNKKFVRTPTILQMEAVECGAAALSIVLAYYGNYVPLEELRIACGVSRDGSKAKNILRAARTYGLESSAYSKDIHDLLTLPPPFIIFWEFNHFLVVEGFGSDVVYLNDPAVGRRQVSLQEFDESFTGIVLTFAPGKEFKKSQAKPSIIPILYEKIKSSWDGFLYAVLCGFALVVPGLIIPAFGQIFVDTILVHHMTDWLRPLLIGMFVTAMLRVALTGLQARCLNDLELKLAISGSIKFFWHVLRLPVEFYQQRFSGDIASRLHINQRVADLIARRLTDSSIDTMMIVFYAGLLILTSWKLSCFALGCLLLNGILARYIKTHTLDDNIRLSRENGKLKGISIRGLQAIETLKATGSESDFFAAWSGYQAKRANAQRSLRYKSLLSQVPVLFQIASNVLILIFGAREVIIGQITAGMLVAFQSLTISLTDPINRSIAMLDSWQETESDLKRLNDVMQFPIESKWNQTYASDGVSKLSGDIRLKDITFGYSKLDPPLIENFSLKLKSGMRVALVGASGSGKSTVSKLISGLYHPWSGKILIDGTEMEKIDPEILSNSVAFVNQEIAFFKGTVRENLTLWDDSVPEEHIIQACKDACIHDDIVSRLNGYDSAMEEGGSNWSGGQRQRMEIARALVYQPSILVLDEATSALDTISEKQIDNHLRRRSCTTIVIAHRLSTIRDADEIIVMERGKIIQRGTHPVLLKDVCTTYLNLVSE